MSSSMSARSQRELVSPGSLGSLSSRATGGGRAPAPRSARSTSTSYAVPGNSGLERTSSVTSARRARTLANASMSELPTTSSYSHTQANAMKVYVRVRPFSEREIAQKVSPHSTVRIDPQNPAQLTILEPARGFRPLTTHPFTRCFWSVFEQNDGGLLNKVDTYLIGGMNSARRSRAQAMVNGGQPAPGSVRRSSRMPGETDPMTPPTPAYDGAGSAPVMVDANVSHPPYAGQDEVYVHVGKPIVENTLDGYNGCVFAYGQTGSGKTFTMLGYAPSKSDIRARARTSISGATPLEESSTLDGVPDAYESDDGDDVVDKTGLDPNELQGIIPRSCTDLFEGLRAKRAKDSDFTYRVEVSYYEIYNEKVFDLIRPQSGTDLKIRHGPTGPFIEDLAWKVVNSEESVAKVIRRGMQERHTAATKFNDRSSRSHAILTFNIVQLSMDDADNAFQMRSKLSLVDLAGSERTGAAGAEGDEFHDGVKINQSLTVLGRVIDRLADLSKNRGARLAVPYRESKLTWVLSDSIGGNSQTSMVATVSPHAINYDEMRQTIMYASRAQQVLNEARRNVDPMIMQLRELRAQIADLQLRLKEAGGSNYTNEYVRGLERRVKELEWQCGDQGRIISQLRAELESAGIADPTLVGKQPSGRHGSASADASGTAGNGAVEAAGGGGVSGATYRRTNDQLTAELTSANREIVRLQKELLESERTTKGGHVAAEADATIAKLQAKCDQYRSAFRDWEAQLNQYNTYQWRWSTDYVFSTFEDKMNLLVRQCQNLMMDKDALVMDTLSRGESAQLRETAKIQRQHSAEVATLTAQYRETVEKLKKEYVAKEEERLKRQKELTNSSEFRMQATRDTFDQEKRRWTQERDNMKIAYEEKLATMRAEYQDDLRRLRETLAPVASERQRPGGVTLQELQERHDADMKSFEQDMERERKRREAELEMVRRQTATELSRKDEQLAAHDAQARRAEEEAAKLRRDNLKLQTDMRTKERQLGNEIKDLLLKQENMIAVSNTILSNYEKNPANLDSDIATLRAFVSDKDYAAFRAKAKEMAFRDPALSRRSSAIARSPAATDDLRSRDVEDMRAAIESMRKSRIDHQANLQKVQQDVYEQLSRSRGFQAGGEVDERNDDSRPKSQNGKTV